MLACVFFIWRMGTLFRVRPHAHGELPPGVRVFELFGSLFFGAVGKIEALPAQLPEGTRAVVLEMHRLISMDTSGLEALQQLHRVLQRRGIALVLADVNEQPLSLIRALGLRGDARCRCHRAQRRRGRGPVPSRRGLNAAAVLQSQKGSARRSGASTRVQRAMASSRSCASQPSANIAIGSSARGVLEQRARHAARR